MDAVQQPEKELLCIMLRRSLILRCMASYHLLEVSRHSWVILTVPEALEQHSKLLSHVAIRAEFSAVRLLPVDVVLVLVGDKVLGQLVGVAEALDDGVHEASVAMVVQSTQTRNVVAVWNSR